MTADISEHIRTSWQVPAYEKTMWLGKQHATCIIIPVINEGSRIVSLLTRMKDLNVDQASDVIIIDGGSTDGSLELERLKSKGVRGPVSYTHLTLPTTPYV